jgi:hypothetical protein
VKIHAKVINCSVIVVQIHADVISYSVIVVKIHGVLINRSMIVVKIHAAMVSCAVNDLQNEEDLKILDLGILFFSYF